jgi:hypothetical protein
MQVLEHAGREDAPLLLRVRACRETVWRCCVEAVARDPAADQDVPADAALATAHRAMARSATAMAQVAQALVMAADDPAPAARAATTATARADEAAAALGLAGPQSQLS